MATHSSTLAWKIPRTEEPGGLQSMGSLRVRHNRATSLSLFTFMHWRRKWQPTRVLAWRIPGMGEPSGLPSMGSHRVGHDWSDLAAAASFIHFSSVKGTSRWREELPRRLRDKESACQCRRHGFDPWSGKILHDAEQLRTRAQLLTLCVGAQELQPLKPGSPPAPQRESNPPLAATREKPAQQRRPCTAKTKNK